MYVDGRECSKLPRATSWGGGHWGETELMKRQGGPAKMGPECMTSHHKVWNIGKRKGVLQKDKYKERNPNNRSVSKKPNLLF